MGPKEVFSYLVPQMFWWKFHDNRMLGSAKTKLPPITLTSWVKDASPFGREKGLDTGSLKKVFLGLKRDGFLQITAGAQFAAPRAQFAGAQFA